MKLFKEYFSQISSTIKIAMQIGLLQKFLLLFYNKKIIVLMKKMTIKKNNQHFKLKKLKYLKIYLMIKISLMKLLNKQGIKFIYFIIYLLLLKICI